ncbi:MAG: ammonium transporter, partial [Hymenobacter sp.]
MSRKQLLARPALAVLVVLALAAAFVPRHHPDAATDALKAADIAWMLVSTALVLLMTPGLAFFYGGMVNRGNIISTMLQSFISLGVISLLWYVV